MTESKEDRAITDRMRLRVRNAVATRFDDAEVILPDDPRFFDELPGWSSDVQRRAQRWAQREGQALLVGVRGDYPHALLNENAVNELIDNDRLASTSPARQSTVLELVHVEESSGFGLESDECEFQNSLDHASFWVDSRWPTSPMLRWFRYGDPGEHFPVPGTTEYTSKLIKGGAPTSGPSVYFSTDGQRWPR